MTWIGLYQRGSPIGIHGCNNLEQGLDLLIMATHKAQRNDENLRALLACIGDNLRKYRTVHKLTLRELSERSGIALSTIHEIEDHKVTNLELITITSIANSFKIKPIELMNTNRLTLSQADTGELAEALKELSTLLKAQTQVN